MDVITLSRLQFAITTIYHFLFVPVSLGLSIFHCYYADYVFKKQIM